MHDCERAIPLYWFASSAAAIAGPILAGGLIDVTNYAFVWLFSAVFMVLAFVVMLLLRDPRPPQCVVLSAGQVKSS